MWVYRCKICGDKMFGNPKQPKRGDIVNYYDMKCYQGHKSGEYASCKICGDKWTNSTSVCRIELWIKETKIMKKDIIL